MSLSAFLLSFFISFLLYFMSISNLIYFCLPSFFFPFLLFYVSLCSYLYPVFFFVLFLSSICMPISIIIHLYNLWDAQCLSFRHHKRIQNSASIRHCVSLSLSVAVLDKSTRKLYRLQEHLRMWTHFCTAVCKLNAPTLQCWSEALRTSRRRIIPRRGILHICGIREESTIRWRRYLPPPSPNHPHLLPHPHARAAYNLHPYCEMPRSSLFSVLFPVGVLWRSSLFEGSRPYSVQRTSSVFSCVL
jgi:hypothetical protein